MMFLPLVALASLFVVGYVATRPKESITRVSGVDDPARRLLASCPHLHKLLVMIRAGHQPSQFLINEAMCEAYEQGAWDIVRKLQRKYGSMAIDREDPEREVLEEDGGNQEIESTTVIGKDSIKSPFEGIPDQAWDSFVARLSTQKEDFESDKHIGRFHHSKGRLEQLGIKIGELKEDPGKQYQALITDLSASKDAASDVINDFTAHPIKVGDQDHVITLSGIMGILKSAGPQRARSWLTNPDDRIKFPHTTKMFLETNGVF